MTSSQRMVSGWLHIVPKDAERDAGIRARFSEAQPLGVNALAIAANDDNRTTRFSRNSAINYWRSVSSRQRWKASFWHYWGRELRDRADGQRVTPIEPRPSWRDVADGSGDAVARCLRRLAARKSQGPLVTGLN